MRRFKNLLGPYIEEAKDKKPRLPERSDPVAHKDFVAAHPELFS